MKLIYGECQSGKSTKALSLLNKDTKSVYFVLDFDRSISKWTNYKMGGFSPFAKHSDNFKVQYVNRYFEPDVQFDIEFSMYERGVIKDNLKQIVVDPINFLVNKNHKTLQDVIAKLKEIEEHNDVEVIAVMNTSFYLDEIKKIENCELIETRKSVVFSR